jgi:subtilisin
MATPHVAGLAALLLDAKPKAKVSGLEAAILESCVRPRGMSADRGGRGIPSAPKALEAL